MLKIERDKLLIAAVLILVISIDMINTSMLSPILPKVPSLIPFFAVGLLVIRFFHIQHYSFVYLIVAPIFLFIGFMIYHKTGNLNALMYIMLILFLYNAEMESILKMWG